MYRLIEAYRHKENLNDELSELSSCLCEYMNFDLWKIIAFNKNKLYGFEIDIELSHGGNEKIFFDRLKQESYLNLLLDEKKIVYYEYSESGASNYDPVSKDALVELYFPLFLNNDSEEVIGCFYLSKNNYLETNIKELLTDKCVTNQIISIQRLLNILYSEYIENNDFLDLVHVFKEINKTREPLEAGHPFNVAYLCNLIGLELGFTAERLHKLYMAAILHDIGKIYIPKSILSKKDPLTEMEKGEIQKHPSYSYNIVKILASRHKNLSGIEAIVLQHHERYDGTGYPNGIKAEDILLESRILAVADSVDAMLSERSYKNQSQWVM